MSLRWLMSAPMEKLMMQSPGEIFSNLKFLWIRVNLLSREYLRSSRTSPVSYNNLLMIFSARSSPHKWTLLAFTPKTALVQAHPRSLSPIIWISSITATSYSYWRGAASMVQLIKFEFMNSFSCPVTNEQFYSFCWYSHAKSLKGAMYIPLPTFSPRSSSTAAVDFPELVGPWW